MIKQRGTTLIEVLVATVLLVSITGIISLSLVVVFDGYAWTQKRGDIDQDGQYILARLKYASSQQDPHILISQPTGVTFSKTGASFTGTQVTPNSSESITLTEGASQGEYTSPIFDLGDTSRVGSFVIFTNRPTGSKIEYQIAVAQKSGGSCESSSYIFVGTDSTPNTRFSTDYFIAPTNSDGVGYENPGACVRYKIYMEGETSPTIFQVLVKR